MTNLVKVPESPASPRASRRPHLLQSAEARVVPSPAGALKVFRWGDAGPRVLLLHGWDGQAFQMEHFVEPLLARGYVVIALDAPGHGESGGRLDVAEDFLGAIQAIEAVYGNFEAIVGHSLGGAAALQAHLTGRLQVARVVTLGAPVEVEKFSLRQVAKPETASRRWARLALGRFATWFAASESSVASWEDFCLERRRRENRADILIVHDRDDRIVSFEQAQELAWRTNGSILHATEGLGHNRVLRNDAVIARVVAFVSGEAKPDAA
mgnify:CR=1 FL=1